MKVMDFKIIANSKAEEGVHELVLSGQLVVANAAKIKAELVKQKIKAKQLKITIKDAEDIDVSVVQLIHSFAMNFESKDVTVNYNFQLNNDLTVLLSRAGILSE